MDGSEFNPIEANFFSTIIIIITINYLNSNGDSDELQMDSRLTPDQLQMMDSRWS